MTQAKYFDYDEKEEYEEEEVKVQRKPGEAPDGGWGWMIVFGAFLCSLLIEGLLFSFDEIKDEIGIYYAVDVDALTSVRVLMAAFAHLAGPLTSGLIKKFGCRKVAMVGSCVTCASLLVSTQMPSVALLRFTYGVLGGIGVNMVYLPSLVIVGCWFEHKRAFATGVAVMGAGGGVFIFGPLIRHLLDNNDWRNTTVIVAAIFLNCAAAGALFRPLTYAKAKGMKRGVIQRGAIMKALIAEKERQRTISNGSLDNCIITKDNRLIKIDKIDLRNKSSSYINRLKETFGFSSRSLNRSKNSLVVPKVVVDPIYRPKSPRSSSKLVTPKCVSSPPTPKRDSGSDSGCGSLENSPKLQPHSSYETLPNDDPWVGNLVVKLPPKGSNDAKPSCSNGNCNNVDDLNNIDSTCTSSRRNVEEKLDPSVLSNNASPAGSVRSVRTIGSSRVRTISNNSNSSQCSKNTSICIPMHRGSVMTVPSSMRSLEMSTIYEEEEPQNCKVCRKVCKLLDLQLLKSPSFLLLSLTGFLTMFGFVIPFVHLPLKAEGLGSSKFQSMFLISVLWAVHMIGRFAMGWIADRPVVSPIQLNNVMTVLAGFLSFFAPMYINNSWLGAYAAFFGLFTATFFTLRTIILIELFGKDRLTCSFGLLVLFQGFAILAGNALSGVLKGNMAFTVVGVLLVGAGLLGFPLPRLRMWEKKHEKVAKDYENYNEYEIVHIEEIPPETLKVDHCESSI